MSDLLQMGNFQDCLEQTFTCELDADLATDLGQNVMDIELVEVVALPPKESEVARREPFSLVFHGPEDVILPQQIYRLKNENFGEAEIFLVPLAPGQYEAVFT